MRLLPLFGFFILYVTIITCARYDGYSKNKYSIKGFNLVTKGARKFSGNFYQKLALLDMTSQVNSPLSLFFPLSLLMYATRGSNRVNYMKVVGLRRNETKIARRGYERLVHTLSKYDLRISGKIYFPVHLVPRITYLYFVKNVFDVPFELVDTAGPVVLSKKINNWLRVQTNDHFPKLLKEPLQTGSRPSILVASSVYFKGLWQSPFDRSLTRNRPFYAFRTVFDVPTMYKFDRLPYGRLDSIGASFVELAYRSSGSSNTMSMFVLLPDEGQSVNMMIWKLQNFDVRNLLTGVPTDVHLYLPKFKLESSVELGSLFDRIFGTSNPFKESVNLYGLSMSQTPVSFGDSVTNYAIEIDENGDTAAGSTATYYKDKIQRRHKKSTIRLSETPTSQCATEPFRFEKATRAIEFNVNRPFLGIIATEGEVVLEIFTFKFTGRGPGLVFRREPVVGRTYSFYDYNVTRST